MRFVFSLLVGLVFVVSFLAFFLATSITGYIDDSDRLVDSAREIHLHERIVDMAAEHIAEKVAADSTLVPMAEAPLRVMVARVLSREWLEKSLRASHGAFRTVVRGVEERAVVDLHPLKMSLRESLAELEENAERDCEQLLGAELCNNAAEARQIIASVTTQGNLAIDRLPESTDLLRYLGARDRQEVEKLREGLQSIEDLRMLCLAVMVFAFAILLALQAHPLRRMLRVGAGTAIFASLVFLLAVAVSAEGARESVEKGLSRSGPDAMPELAAACLQQVAIDLFGGATLAVVGVILVSVVVLGLSLALPGARSERP